ncbi:hypothetical protein QBC46DRAFT_57523 [Diplogelasinospora grovesii]|uniref:Apple domain-containing protein n=1 Tax=Diplogelasinospora grovesii TaxID=303347 RepID=A0AAN6NBT4_9PEZI|nr:hypothetical protein QBC46DRAFT_57523 [Diplogelasinospora grovesii]
MQLKSVVLVSLLPLALAGKNCGKGKGKGKGKGTGGGNRDKCDPGAVLELLAGSDIPRACSTDVAKQATAFCSSYLSIPTVTVYNSTITPTATATVTDTTTTSTTTTEQTTTTAISTLVGTVTETSTVTASSITGQSKRRQAKGQGQAVSCSTLSNLPIAQNLPASKIRSACNCLSVSTATVTLPTTAPAVTVTSTTTAVSTESLTETSTSTELSTTATTTTSTATVTVSPPPVLGKCDVAYDAAGNGAAGNTVQVLPAGAATSARDCCEQCQAKPNCIASAYVGGTCQHLVKTAALAGAPTSAQCPLGIEDYNFGAPAAAGVVYQGPCAY